MAYKERTGRWVQREEAAGEHPDGNGKTTASRAAGEKKDEGVVSASVEEIKA
jgi:hypothetical protein